MRQPELAGGHAAESSEQHVLDGEPREQAAGDPAGPWLWARPHVATWQQATRAAQQDAPVPCSPPRPLGPETGRVRADAEDILASFRAEAARDRDQLRADLRIRAEPAERQADAYRDELDQLRTEATHHTTSSRTLPRTRLASQP